MARRRLDAEGRHWRDEFKMRKWFDGEDFRRPTYFESLDWIIDQLGEDGVDPPDEAVQNMLAIMIEQDDSFTSHIFRSGVVADWKVVRYTCAGMIMELYIKACEDETWPVT